MTNALRASPSRTGMIVRCCRAGASLVREAWEAPSRMLGFYFTSVAALLSSAASWEIGSPHHNLWIQYAFAGGAILIMTQMRHLQRRTLAFVERGAGTPLLAI